MNANLEKLGFDEHFSTQIRPHEIGLQAGRVAFTSHGIYVVAVGSGRNLQAELKGNMRREAAASAEGYPVVGDWLLVEQTNSGQARIVRTLKRRNALIRREQSRREAGRRASSMQTLAANIDWGLITTSLNEEWNARRLERYIALVLESKARPAILLTKADLAPDGGKKALAETQTLAQNLPVLLLSTPSRQGFAKLHGLLGTHGTAVLIGSSGVGKSTLVNALLGEDIMPTAAIRPKDSHGRHTTAGRHLHLLPQGGCIIDSPGLRDLGLGGEASVDAGYAEIPLLASACRFSDCRHTNEPGCAVRAALESGDLDTERWTAYAKLRDETAEAGTRVKNRRLGNKPAPRKI